MKKKIVGILVVTLLIATMEVNAEYFGESDSVDSSVNVGAGSSVQNVTFRLLAVERHFADADGNNVAMKSAEYLIKELKNYNNWINGSTSPGFKYTNYIHLLSSVDYNDIIDKAKPHYVGTPTKTNVLNEITNFLTQTLPGEDYVVRIFYYIGHSGSMTISGTTSYYLQLGNYIGDRLYDSELNEKLPFAKGSDDWKLNSTVVILDSCYSGGFLNTLSKPGRNILTACRGLCQESPQGEKAWGWTTTNPQIAPGFWGWFTGQVSANNWDGTKWGSLGIIGWLPREPIIILFGQDNKDRWISAGEVFFGALLTTFFYSRKQSAPPINEGAPQHPQACFNSLMIPLVQHDPNTPYPFCGKAIKNLRNLFDWSMFRNGSGHTGFSPAIGPLTSGLLWSKPLESPVQSSSAIVDGLVFEGTLGGGGTPIGLYVLDVVTGDVIWDFETANAIISSPAVIDGMVFFGTTGGIFYSLNVHTGFVRWSHEFEPGTEILSSPVVVDDRVFISTMGGGGNPIHVHAFNETTGELLWSSNTLGSGMVYSSPAVADGKVYIGGGDNNLYCLYANNGEIDWEYPTGGEIYSSPAVADDKVFFGCSDQKLYCLNTDGTPCWTYTAGGGIYSSPAVDSDKSLVIVGCANGNVYAVDEMTGTYEWDYYTGPIHMSSPAISKNELVYIGSMNNKIYCLNETTGEEVWSYETEGPIESSPAITDDHVLIGSNDGNVYCLGPPFPVHNIAVTSVTVSPNEVSPGDPVKITYTVKNKGNVPETFNTTIAYNTTPVWTPPLYDYTTPIHNETITLQPGADITKTYIWDTTNVPPGKYTISGQALGGPYETDIRDNIYMDDTVTVPRGRLLTNTLFLRLLERFPNAFPILQRLLLRLGQ